MEEKGNSGLGIILIIVLIGLCGYFVWMYFVGTKTEEQKEEVMSEEKALNLVEEKYILALKTYKLQNVYELSEKTTINDEEYYQATDYDEVMKKIFTDKGKEEFENYHAGTLIKKEDKVYIKATAIDNELNYDDNYQQTTFTKEEIKNDEITYIAKAIYQDNEDEQNFVLKKKNNEWLVEKFYFPYTKEE